MTSRPEPPTVEQLHAEYCKLVFFPLTLTLDRIYWWEAWRSRFTMEDLRLVVGYLQREIKAGRRNLGATKWSNLIQQADRFEEELCTAKGAQRNAKPPLSAKERVLRQARPVACEAENGTVTAKPVAEYVAKAIEGLRRAAD